MAAWSCVKGKDVHRRMMAVNAVIYSEQGQAHPTCSVLRLASY